jgi:serine/threonine-protein kinase HipA
MGALVYEPDHSQVEADGLLSLDKLAEQAQDVMDGRSEDVIQMLLDLNGSSAGARPKALIGVDKSQTKYIPWREQSTRRIRAMAC